MRSFTRLTCIAFGLLIAYGGDLIAQTIEHNFGSSATLPINLASSAQTTGTLPVARGGTNLTAAADDNAIIGNGTTWQSKAIPTCIDTAGNHLNYDASTNTISCGTSATLSGTSGSIGGGALAAGACASGTVTITGATTSMVAVTSPNTYPGDGTLWDSQVTAADTVTVKVCAVVAATPTASTYNVRVIR